MNIFQAANALGMTYFKELVEDELYPNVTFGSIILDLRKAMSEKKNMMRKIRGLSTFVNIFVIS